MSYLAIFLTTDIQEMKIFSETQLTKSHMKIKLNDQETSYEAEPFVLTFTRLLNNFYNIKNWRKVIKRILGTRFSWTVQTFIPCKSLVLRPNSACRTTVSGLHNCIVFIQNWSAPGKGMCPYFNPFPTCP